MTEMMKDAFGTILSSPVRVLVTVLTFTAPALVLIASALTGQTPLGVTEQALRLVGLDAPASTAGHGAEALATWQAAVPPQVLTVLAALTSLAVLAAVLVAARKVAVLVTPSDPGLEVPAFWFGLLALATVSAGGAELTGVTFAIVALVAGRVANGDHAMTRAFFKGLAITALVPLVPPFSALMFLLTGLIEHDDHSAQR